VTTAAPLLAPSWLERSALQRDRLTSTSCRGPTAERPGALARSAKVGRTTTSRIGRRRDHSRRAEMDSVTIAAALLHDCGSRTRTSRSRTFRTTSGPSRGAVDGSRALPPSRSGRRWRSRPRTTASSCCPCQGRARHHHQARHRLPTCGRWSPGSGKSGAASRSRPARSMHRWRTAFGMAG